MSMTIKQARDEITALVVAAWPSGHRIIFDDKPGEKPDSGPWARLTIRHAAGGQSALTDATMRKMFTRTGFVTVQIFTPVGEGLSRSDDLAKIMLDALEGQSTSGGAWFRNTRVNEIGPDGDWYQVNVVADFTYDEVK